MYEAKGERASHIYIVRVKVDNGELVRIHDDDSAPPSQMAEKQAAAE